MVEIIENQDRFEVDEVPRHNRPLRIGIPSSMELTSVIRNDDMVGEYITSEVNGISVGVVEYIYMIGGKKNYNYNVVVFEERDGVEHAFKSRSYDGEESKSDAKDKAREWAMMVHNGLLE